MGGVARSLYGPIALGVGVFAAVAAPLFAQPSRASSRAEPARTLRVNQAGTVSTGHPNAADAALLAMTMSRASTPILNAGPFDPPDAPLASGLYVNFESPPVRALALSPSGDRLYVANTPNNSLVVFQTTPQFAKIDDIPVGLDPVSVAARPGTNEVWVANFISDSVSVVDLPSRQVVKVIEVGDEPVNILFDDTGDHAFVIVQGSPSVRDSSPGAPAGIAQEGAIVAIDAATRTIIRSQFLDMHTPRAAAWRDGAIAVAALHSGNNTVTVGQPLRFTTSDIVSGALRPPIVTSSLAIAQFFSMTSSLFADPLLSPWPDLGSQNGAPLAQRIVPDIGEASAWKSIVDVFALPDGAPDPAVVNQLVLELNATIPGRQVTNATDMVAQIIMDAADSADHDLAIVQVAPLLDPMAALPAPTYVQRVGTTTPALATDPATDRLLVANMEPLNLTRLEPELRGHFLDHQIVFVDNANAVSRVDLHAGVPTFNDATAPNPAAQAASLANVVDIAVRPDGSRAYVASLGAGRVGVLDPASGAVLGLADAGRGTRSLALDDPADRLYALNRTDLSVSVFDVATDQPALLQTIPLFNPEPAVVRAGRDFLYSARFSNNFSSSCAMCHIDARMDHLAWDLGNPNAGLQYTPHVVASISPDPCRLGNGVNHPLKGPMVTQSLQGLRNHAPFHWRGDKPEFQDFNGAFDGLLGGSVLSQKNIDAYADFVNTIEYPPPAYRNRDSSFRDPLGKSGRNLYINNCNSCHQADHDGAMALDCADGDVGFSRDSGVFAQVQLTAQLRGFNKKLQSDRYTGYGLVHDGREVREDNVDPLDTFLKLSFANLFNNNKGPELRAFMLSYPTNAMPVIGWQVEVGPSPDSTTLNNIDLMMLQQGLTPSRNDVIAKGIVGGEPHCYVLVDPATETFRSDTDQLLSLSELVASLAPADRLIFTAVPPGAGVRMGVNADMDCALDGLDGSPRRNPDISGNGSVGGDDLAILLANWGPKWGPFDLVEDGDVNSEDLAEMLANWGTCN